MKTKRGSGKLYIAYVLALAAIVMIGVAGWRYRTGKTASVYAYRPERPVKIIFDTDMDTDVDDVGALGLLHAYVRAGRAELLAVVGSCGGGDAGACIDAINTYYGLPDIPIGIAQDCPSSGQSSYQKTIAETYANDFGPDGSAEDPVAVYRRTLAGEKDGSVVIVAVGALNNLCGLLRSEPDAYSPSAGPELVKQKVRLVVVMGGAFPESGDAGEYNIRLDPEAADYVAQHCPVSVCWNGFEVGEGVLTGGRIGEMPEDSPIRRAYELYFRERPQISARSSWDLVSVLYAVEGKGTFFQERKGHIAINGAEKKLDPEKGEAYNNWTPDSRSKDAMLVLKAPPESVAEALEERLVSSGRQ